MANKKVPTPKTKTQAFADYKKKHGYHHKADPRHPMNSERTGAPKKMAKGGKLKMVEKGGKKVPFYAADGVGKMAKGGSSDKMTAAMKARIREKMKGSKAGAPTGKATEDAILEIGKEMGVFANKKGGAIKKAKGGSLKIKSGDTLSQIAKKKGVTLKSLLAANPSIKNANQIRVGQSIKIPGAEAGKAAKSSNPYKGMSRVQMADMDVKNKSEKRQRTATRSMQTQAKMGTGMTPTPSKAKAAMEKKSGREAMLEKARKVRARKQAGGMKAGGQAKKYSKGGTVRGAGAATKGKRFGRCG